MTSTVGTTSLDTTKPPVHVRTAKDDDDDIAGMPQNNSVRAKELIGPSRGFTPTALSKLRRRKKLGRGTFGTVYSTADRKLVCKVDRDRGDEGVHECTIREIAALRRLDRMPHVIACMGVGERRRREIFLPRYRFDLEVFLSRSPCWPNRARSFMYQLICGVHAIHRAGLVHRDLKPANILVGDGLVISDFGSARFGIMDDRYSMTGELGTLWYRAPEVLLGECRYTSAVDMWSLGVVMCGLLRRSNGTGGAVDSGKQSAGRRGGNGRFEPLEGDCAIDQLFRCFRLCGTPTDATWPGVHLLPHFKVTFPNWRPQKLGDLFDAADAAAIDLLARILTLDPCRRITAAEALAHDYFRGLSAPELPTLAPHHVEVTVHPDYMSLRQTNINGTMRTILVDWLIDVLLAFHLHHMTFFLACTYLDLFLSRRAVSRRKLQLVGCTAMLLASKVADVHALEVKDFVWISDSTCTHEQIVGMERLMLRTLDYDVFLPTEYTFLMQNAKPPERGALLKKLYRAVLSLSNRGHTWAELLRADIGDVAPKFSKTYNRMCAEIDRQFEQAPDTTSIAL